MTNASGEILLEYTAPVFSGRIAFSAKTLVGNAAVNDQLIVRVPHLVAFPETGNFLLTGGMTEHPKNHYMISQLAIQGLDSAADIFSRQKWNTTGKMKLNDMSLEWGGLFDVEQKGIPPHWTTPHASHRIGRSVDIENIALVKMTVKSRDTGLDTVVTAPTLSVVRNLVDFMEGSLADWKFEPEHQLEENPLDREKFFAHFEWKGK